MSKQNLPKDGNEYNETTIHLIKYIFYKGSLSHFMSNLFSFVT